ncbi:RNA polymerase sigma-70 factor [Sunxiuqinia dokdonensis]|uniref:RNA polymerase sigma-70 factor n=1 Tax=Sunxiuqinia dokdonensis TaxID=1409788 RepID=UPI00069E194B|nr:RNA polymerase sigma-70 factor [Sunxiuqinia dokdonensis]
MFSNPTDLSVANPGLKHQLSYKEFETFFRANFQAAALLAFRYLDDPGVVEDIVQESFITLWEKQSEIFRSQEELKKYLLVTVRNRTISYLRSIKIRHVELDAALVEAEADDDHLHSDEELAVRISKAIQKLPVKCREVFLLAYSDGLSYKDIAGKLSISKNTVKTQMVIAYRVLRRELKGPNVGLLFFFRLKTRHVIQEAP